MARVTKRAEPGADAGTAAERQHRLPPPPTAESPRGEAGGGKSKLRIADDRGAVFG